ncbi:MAG: hypothetical protein MJZ08_09900, partial [Bacteroidaceae bacterium]|nr:hypothetical protein [Bacteroidaceae bacterium]
HEVQTCKEEGNEKIFFYYMITQDTGELKAFALAERGMLRRYTQGVALLCPGLMGVSLSGYCFADNNK